ncbi:MAG: phospholipid/cholesterol/gamma-HCH transport system substrate-binding protein, partial [Burkholderiales bacterium]
MENRAHALSAGLFLLLLGVGLVLAVLRLTGDTAERVDYLIESRWPVSGLQPSAPVRLRGVNVGKVADIRFSDQDPRLIFIRIAVDRDAPITRGTYGQLGYLGITGLTFVQLDDDGSHPEKLASSIDKPARLEMRPSLIDQVSGSGQELVQETTQAIKRVNALLNEENLSQLSDTISNINAASANIARLTSDLRPAAKALTNITAHTDTTLQRVDPLLVDLDKLTRDARGPLDRIGRSAEDLGQTSRALESTVPRVNRALDDFSRSLRTADRVLT